VATGLALRLAPWSFDLVLTSPLSRARDTASLAGFGSAEVDEDLLEWDYGSVEGLTTASFRETVPGWSVWRDGCPGGESVADVGARADRVIERVRAASGPVLAFAHGHLLRILAARWLGLEPVWGRAFVLDPATVSVLGWERETPALRRWNDQVD
jgi:probable phosphoglycerate mutase